MATELTYVLRQRFRYEYPEPVRQLRHRLMVVPPRMHGQQTCVSRRVTVAGEPARLIWDTDGFGNSVVMVRAQTVRAAIDFQVSATIRRRNEGQPVSLPDTALTDRRLLDPTRLTAFDGPLAAVARGIARRRDADPLDVAERLCAWAHGALAYGFGSTTVRTTAIEALAAGRGVCQDYAHIMLALCRARAVPARYVSGHLVGEGGSHAWVEVLVPDPRRSGRAMAVAFDPTHDRRAGSGYLTVAIGRDYVDVAPTSGAFDGSCAGLLSASKELRVLPPAPGAASLNGR